MTNRQKAALSAVLGLGGGGVFAWLVWVQFSHPDVTDTRLLIDYWPWYAVALGLLAAACVLLPER